MELAGLARVGDECGGYTIVESLGQMGMAERYRARSADGGAVLIDVLAVHHPDLLERLRGARLPELVHPGLLPVREVISVLRFPALVMDDSDGVPLERWLEGAPDLEERLMVFRSVVEALNVLHSRGLVHADLQPDAILVEEDSALVRVRLALPGVASTVFALVRDGKSVSTSGAALGRPEYLAPERARTPEKADMRSDMFSLGCLLYLLISGRSPFAGLDRFACFQAARDEAWVLLDDVVPDAPHAMVELCHALLRAHPEDRLQHCGEVVDRLDASGVSRPPGTAPRPVQRRVPLQLVLGLAGLAVVAVIVAAWALG